MPQRPARTVYSEGSSKRIILPDWYVPEMDPDDKPLISECGNYWYDPEEAWRWVAWCTDFCVHVDGRMSGEPYDPLDWQKNATRELFGWRRLDAHGNKIPVRKYRKGFFAVPRKNSKTTWGASIALGMTKIDGEPAAQNFMLAGTEKQSKDNAFRIARDMISVSEALKDLGFEDTEEGIYDPETRSIIRAISSTPHGKTGSNGHLVYVDELHEFPDERLIHAVWTGVAARVQPLLFITTTAGEDPEAPWAIEWDYALDVINGKIKDDAYFGVIYEPDKGDDWQDRKVWAAVNPGYGKSVNAETLEDLFKGARTPSAKRKFRQFNLNFRESGATEFITTDQWDACFKEFDEESFFGEQVFGGLDLASVRDMTNYGVIKPYWVDDVVHYDALIFSFCPKDRDEDRDLEYKYDKFVEQGILEETEGNTTDYRAVRRRIVWSRDHMKLDELGYDDWNAPELAQNLQDKDEIKMVNVAQTMKGIGPATKRLEELILAKQFHHNGNAILRWNVGNARVIVDHKENKMLSKKRSKEKIDGLASLVNALSRAMVAPPPRRPRKAWVIQ